MNRSTEAERRAREDRLARTSSREAPESDPVWAERGRALVARLLEKPYTFAQLKVWAAKRPHRWTVARLRNVIAYLGPLLHYDGKRYRVPDEVQQFIRSD